MSDTQVATTCLLESSVSSLSYIGSGVACSVYSWSEGEDEVVKTFAAKYIAEDVREAQMLGADYGLAPDVTSDVFRIYVGHDASGRGRGGRWRWAFTCQRVDTDHGCTCDGWSPDGEVTELIAELDASGLPSGDMHMNNVGRLPDGRLVRIDWGEESA